MSKKNLIIFIVGLLATFIIVVCIRFLTYSEPVHIHYHANFALFIDGQRVDFSKPQYMEEVSSCDVSTKILPKQRVHLHNNVGDLVHVHDDGVTWGHFFNNLGFSISDSTIVDDKGTVYQTSGEKKLAFILNGKQTDSVFNKLIESEDRLLISYGTETMDSLTGDRFSQIASTSKEYNTKQDPAACSGDHTTTFWERLKESVFFWREWYESK